MAASGLFAALLLLSLAPLPHAAAMSNHTWRVELAVGLFLLGSLTIKNVRFALESALSKRVAVFIALFAVWGLISGLWASSFASAVHHTIVWCEYGLFFVLASTTLKAPGRVFLLSTFIWFTTIIGLVTISDYASLPDFKSLEGILRTRYSAYGELTVTIAPLLWAVAMYQRRTKSWLLAMLPAALGWVSAMLSLSRGVFLAGIAGSVVAFAGAMIFGRQIHRKRVAATAAIWLTVTIAVQVGFSLLTPIPATVDYLSGKADPTRESSAARLFIWRTTLPLVEEHPLTGVGADNFGAAANEGRAEFRRTHPADLTDEINSDHIVERAHDEPLQILAELGLPGFVLFVLPLVIFGWYVARSLVAGKRRPSSMFWAALGGMVAFGVSSMVSSFSFRIVQNGIAFFFVFAFAVYELARTDRSGDRASRIVVPKAAVTCLLILAIAVLAVKGVAEYSFAAGDETDDKTEAQTLFTRAATFDPDYAAAHYRLSGLAFDRSDHPTAAAELRTAIDRGLGVDLTYSALADCYAKAGDASNEFKTFDEALRIFPRSIFLRVRYAIELEKDGRKDDADHQLDLARAVSQKDANGWYSLITRGSLRTFLDAQDNTEMSAPADLRPEPAVLQYLDKEPGQ